MSKYILLALAMVGSAASFSFCDALSKNWAEGQPLSKWLFYLVVLAPVAYLIFGYITKQFGLALTGSIVNILIVLFTILIGLFYYHEWQMITPIGYIGIFLAVIALFLIIFFGSRTDLN